MRPGAVRERMPVVVFVVLIAFVGGAVLELIQLAGDDGDSDSGARARSTIATTAPLADLPTVPAPPIPYTVQRGDTLTGIARRFGVAIDAIVAANQLTDLDRLVEGQVLLVPPPPPVVLVVAPPVIRPGGTTELQLTGAKPSEGVVFEIVSPTGTFTGPTHNASADGTVTTTYTPGLDALAGIYRVTARGSEGTTAQATFRVEAALR